MTLGPPGGRRSGRCRRALSPWRARKSSHHRAELAPTRRGMSREKIAFSPSSATSQPMMSRLCGQVCSPAAAIAGPSPPQRSTAAAAPSPNSAVATMLLCARSSRRNYSVHSSTTSSSTGLVRASPPPAPRRAPGPCAPPAQPSPKIGSRWHRARQTHAAHQQRIEARRRDAGGRHGDDARRSRPGAMPARSSGARPPPRSGRARRSDRRGCARARHAGVEPFRATAE